MIARTRSIGVATVALVLTAACGSGAGSASPTSTTAATSTTDPSDGTADVPSATFAAISEDPVTDEVAAKLQAALALHDVTGGGGISAPALVYVGSEDQPELSRRTADALGVELLELLGLDHRTDLMATDAVMAVVAPFLATTT